MKVNLVLLLFLFPFASQIYAQPGQWSWENGDTLTGSPGHFGIQGMPDPLNTPPSVAAASYWTGIDGDFWLFGGWLPNFEWYSDLWKFDVQSKAWTWVKGPGIPNQRGTYGDLNVPSMDNNPGARSSGSFNWVDSAGNLWLFGGYGYDSTAVPGYLNDLWKYNVATNVWTWVKGPCVKDDPGSYGTMQVSDPANLPSARSCFTYWDDNESNFWLFGGGDDMGVNYQRNDLWKYDIGTNCWTWMNGTPYINMPSVFGTQGVPSPLNTPGARGGSACWEDYQGDLWLFGGLKYNGWPAPDTVFNDLWKYSVTGNQWTWAGGPYLGNSLSAINTFCSFDSLNYPGGRCGNVTWKGDCDHVFMFGSANGGFPLPTDEFWCYSTMINDWSVVDSLLSAGQHAVYGLKGVPDPGNTPGFVRSSCAWKDHDGNFWLFSGQEALNGWTSNTLWKYIPDPQCPSFPVPGNITVSNDTAVCEGDSITLTATGGLYYLWSPDLYINNISISNPVVFPDSSMTYTVTVTDVHGCKAMDSLEITILLMPLITVSGDTLICSGDTARLIASGATTYHWHPSRGLSDTTASLVFAIPETTATYMVSGTNLQGCSDTCKISISVMDCDLTIPNVFTPNNDGKNDDFNVLYKGMKEYHLEIFNRWGSVVFETSDLREQWDGKYKGRDAPEGVYFYWITYGRKTYSGSVTLLR